MKTVLYNMRGHQKIENVLRLSPRKNIWICMALFFNVVGRPT